MTHADRLLRSPATFRRLTGLTPAAFRRLLGELAAPDAEARTRRAARPGRPRKPGGGRAPALPLADRLLMLMVPDRTSVPHTFLGFLFGLDDRNVSRGIRRLEPLRAGIFRIPERTVVLTPGEIGELFFDTTERPTGRPVRGQKRYDSGKKRRHTLKTPVVVVRGAEAAGPGAATAAGADRGRVPDVPRVRPRQEGVRPGPGGDPGRGDRVRGHGVPGDRP